MDDPKLERRSMDWYPVGYVEVIEDGTPLPPPVVYPIEKQEPVPKPQKHTKDKIYEL